MAGRWIEPEDIPVVGITRIVSHDEAALPLARVIVFFADGQSVDCYAEPAPGEPFGYRIVSPYEEPAEE